jgi:amino acid transporter
MGLLAIWCEFAQTIFFYPALLAYVADTFAYVIDPRLAGNGVYTAAVIIVLFWGGVLVSSRGVPFVAELSSSGTVIGTPIPGAILVALGAAYLLQGNHPAAPMTVQHLLPPWHGLASIVLVVNSFFTYAGIEVNAVHVNELRNPGRDYPKSIFVAMSLVLAGPHPPDAGDLLGDPLTSDQLHRRRHAGLQHPPDPLRPRLRGVADRDRPGGCGARRDAHLARRPVQGAAADRARAGFLPPYFQKVNGHGIEVRILAAQGTVISLIALLYASIPSVSHAYWIFAAMATQVYLIMYVLMFIAAMRLRRSRPDHPRGYRAPAIRLLCLLGALSSVATLVIGFVPPAQFGHSNPLVYALLILAAILAIGILPPLSLGRLRKPGWKATSYRSASQL